METGALLSNCRRYRYRLWRIWNKQVPPLMWIMLNPSTADEMKDDPTIRKCIRFSLNAGFGGAIIHNLFAWRATFPGELLQVKDPVGILTDQEMIDDGAKGYKIVCAWGNVSKSLLWRVENVKEFMSGLELNYLKMNSGGQPAHPLYLPYTSKIKKWEPHTNGCET